MIVMYSMPYMFGMHSYANEFLEFLDWGSVIIFPGKIITLAETFYITCWKTLIHLKEVLHLREDIITLVYSVADPDLYRRGCKSRAWSVNAVSWYIILW